MTEQELIAKRAQLREYRITHPDWSIPQLAEATNCSPACVRKWLKRLNGTSLDDFEVLKSQSRAPKTTPPEFDEQVIAKIIRLRDEPPDEIRFTPGPRTICTYLHRDDSLKGKRLPKSPTTIWKILDQYHRIPRPRPFERHPFERPPAGDTWEIDFTDAISGAIEPDKRKKHGVEVFNVVDRGSSVWVDTESSSEFDAEHSLVAMTSILMDKGLPNTIVFDNDTRFVGSWTSEGFPSAFMRFLLCVGVNVQPCPPGRPQDKPFVERLHRSLKAECIRKERPGTLDDVQKVIKKYHRIYNNTRPHQAKVCKNLPPLVAVKEFPVMKKLPTEVDPDKWLTRYHNKYFTRQVTSNGIIRVGKQTYSVGKDLVGNTVTVIVDAHNRQFRIQTRLGERCKAIKGLVGSIMTFEHYLDLMLNEARSESRELSRKRRLKKVRGAHDVK